MQVVFEGKKKPVSFIMIWVGIQIPPDKQTNYTEFFNGSKI